MGLLKIHKAVLTAAAVNNKRKKNVGLFWSHRWRLLNYLGVLDTAQFENYLT